MLVYLILALLILFLWFLLFRIFPYLSKQQEDVYHKLKEDYRQLRITSLKFKQDIVVLTDNLERTIALYDITKGICKSLDMAQVFTAFKEELYRCVKVKDCKFFSRGEVIEEDNNLIIMPIEINKEKIGYLQIEEIAQADEEKFNILAHQFMLGAKRAFLYQRIQGLAISDSLTGVSSRRYCLERLEEELARSRRMNYTFSLLMLDIDHFKICNDRYGHLVGDAVLKETAKAIKESTRQIDLVGRYGGEEFLIVLIETDKMQGRIAAERIRNFIEEKKIKVYDEELSVTVSIGMAIFPFDAKEVKPLINKADKALYNAKESGRNKVVSFSP